MWPPQLCYFAPYCAPSFVPKREMRENANTWVVGFNTWISPSLYHWDHNSVKKHFWTLLLLVLGAIGTGIQKEFCLPK